MTRSLAVAVALVACGTSERAPSGGGSGSGTVVRSRVVEGMSFALPEGWTSAYDQDADAWQMVSADAATTVRLERADERHVASPDAYMHHLAALWGKDKLVTIEQRKNVKSGFAMTLAIFAAASDPQPRHATFVIRELGSAWYSCHADHVEDDAIRDQVIALCKSVKL